MHNGSPIKQPRAGEHDMLMRRAGGHGSWPRVKSAFAKLPRRAGTPPCRRTSPACSSTTHLRARRTPVGCCVGGVQGAWAGRARACACKADRPIARGDIQSFQPAARGARPQTWQHRVVGPSQQVPNLGLFCVRCICPCVKGWGMRCMFSVRSGSPAHSTGGVLRMFWT